MSLTVDNVGGAAVSSSAKRRVPDSDSPSIATPSRISTPPPHADRVHLEVRRNMDSGGSRHSRLSGRASDVSRSSMLDADAVDHALRRELSRQQREGTPGASPHRKRQRINGDR